MWWLRTSGRSWTALALVLTLGACDARVDTGTSVQPEAVEMLQPGTPQATAEANSTAATNLEITIDDTLLQGDASMPKVPPATRQTRAGGMASGPDHAISAGDSRFAANAGPLTAGVPPGPEVVGGKHPNSPTAWSHTVLLAPKSGKVTDLCSGTLVSPDFVLTALHCVGAGKPVELQSLLIFGNSYLLKDRLAVRRAKAVFPYDDASQPANGASPAKKGGASTVDLAMVQLDAPVNLPYAHLASDADLNVMRGGRIVGFGFNISNVGGIREKSIGYKLYGDVAVVSRACDDTATGGSPSDMERYGCTPGLHIIAGTLRPVVGREPDVDACPGDSGGPLFIPVASTEFTRTKFERAMGPDSADYRLAGVTSTSVNTQYVPEGSLKCGNGGKYVRIDGQRRAWIEGLIGLLAAVTQKPEGPP